MPERSKRGAFSRERRLARHREIREEANRFLDTLPPLIKRLVLKEPLTNDEWTGYCLGPGEVRNQASAARQQYEQIIVHDPHEWRRYCRGDLLEHKLIREHALLGRPRGQGAPPKGAEDREGAFIADQVAQVIERLRQGVELRRACKKTGGSAGDDTEIQSKLVRLGYSTAEVRAILTTKAMTSAAVSFVADQTGHKKASIWSSIRRARLERARQVAPRK